LRFVWNLGFVIWILINFAVQNRKRWNLY
jgi:hypothetical protein